MELKCRALTKEARRWVYGYYCELKSRQFIIENDADLELLYGEEGEDGPSVEAIYNFVEVDPKTKGLCTGCKDKNGQEIYEGDIYEFDVVNPVWDSHKKIVVEHREETRRRVVEYDPPRFLLEWYPDKLKIIGNIHEHPKLMEQSQ